MKETVYIETSILGHLTARPDEAAKGDRAIASQWLNLLQSLMLLELTEETLELAQAFFNQGNLPPKASNDALHMALATVYGLDYLLTWTRRACRVCQ